MANRLFQPDSRAAEFFEAICDDLDLFFTSGYQPVPVMKYGFDQIKEWRRQRERFDRLREIKRWKERKLIKIKKKGKELAIALSERGMLENARLSALHAPLLSDGQVCLIAFDIPEVTRKVRQFVREFLRACGFIQVQRSVWSSRREVFKIFHVLQKSQKNLKWIRIFRASEAEMT